MKDFIVLIAFIALGCFIGALILGDSGSLKTATGGFMEKQLSILGD